MAVISNIYIGRIELIFHEYMLGGTSTKYQVSTVKLWSRGLATDRDDDTGRQ